VDSTSKFQRVFEDLFAKGGWTQSSLARASGLQQTLISRWLKGNNTPTLESIDCLAKAFGVAPSVFLQDKTPTASAGFPLIQKILRQLSTMQEDELSLMLEFAEGLREGSELGREVSQILRKAGRKRSTAD
jgi:transcriptional regulator with XRE-family HTH domain